jgi:hypothetical protein
MSKTARDDMDAVADAIREVGIIFTCYGDRCEWQATDGNPPLNGEGPASTRIVFRHGDTFENYNSLGLNNPPYEVARGLLRAQAVAAIEAYKRSLDAAGFVIVPKELAMKFTAP